MSKGKYYPNNWEAIKELPDEFFSEIDYDDIFIHRVNSWEIPSSIDSIIRATHIVTKKTQEFSYSRAGNAQKKLLQLCQTGEYDISVAREEACFFISSKDISDYGEVYEEESAED